MTINRGAPKVTRGHSVSFKVPTAGRPQQAAVTEALEALRDAGVPLDAEWKMAFRKGKEINNGAPFMEPDHVTVDATWAEQT